MQREKVEPEWNLSMKVKQKQWDWKEVREDAEPVERIISQEMHAKGPGEEFTGHEIQAGTEVY